MVELLQIAVLAIFLATSPSFSTGKVRERLSIAPHGWPCPEAADIFPCTCYADETYRLYMDCSTVANEIELANAFQAIFPFYDFYELNIIQEQVTSSKLTTIPAYSFGDITFERIIITHTQIEVIEEEAFTLSNPTLVYWDLSNNKLTDFPFEALPNYDRLETFNIDGNSFTNLAPLVSSSLITFSANRNENLTITVNDFEGALTLQHISMNHINLKGTMIQNMFNTLPAIKTIDLSNNGITDLDDYSFTPVGNPITSLDISNNEINQVRRLAISGLSDSCTFDISNNELVDLSQLEWQPILDQASSGTFDFSSNPLRCGCEIAWIILDADNRYIPLITGTTNCNSGEQLISLDPGFFSRCTTEAPTKQMVTAPMDSKS